MVSPVNRLLISDGVNNMNLRFWEKTETPVEIVSKRIIRTKPQINQTPPEPKGKVRGFDAAAQGNMTADWFAPAQDINSLMKGQLTVMRARSRERMRNDAYAIGAKKMFVTNVVGPTGVKLQAMAKNLNGERDDLAVQEIETAWNRWSKYKNTTDVAGRENWKDVLAHLIKLYITDGEVFVRHITGKDGGEFGYKVQIIDPEMCDEELNTPALNGNRIILGVEVDKWFKPTAYYFKVDPNVEDVKVVKLAGGKKHLRVPADEIIHWFAAEFPNQVRGIPPLAMALGRFKMLGGFEEAALVNARAGASKMGFFTQDGSSTAPGIEDESGELIDEISPGSMSLLPPDVGFTQFDSKYPDGEIAPFKKSVLRAIASGLGIDYPSLGNDLEAVNLSSARVAIAETREMWKAVQQTLIDNVITPVFEQWLFNALLRNQMMVAGKPLSINNIEKYKEVHWLARRWAFPDPLKDSKAAQTMLDNRVKSLSSVAADLGIDWEQELELMSRDEKLLEKYGLQRMNTGSIALEQLLNEVDFDTQPEE